jgi:serine phosphatase RsbU (regulator of sigma subunit)
LFENLNTRFYQSSAAHKFVSLIYGEISEDATFRFLAAAQPAPLVFSRAHGKLIDMPEEACVSFPPIGVLPSFDVIDRHRTSTPLGFKPRYEMNEWRLLGQGDLMLLGTDGLADHERDGETYCRTALEATLRACQDEDARTIFDAITTDLRAFGPPTDDVSLVVIKRTSA